MEAVRIDKWLWAARFFRLRSLAADAVKGGHVTLNGTRAKASKTVRIGDVVCIRKGQERWEVHVVALADRRGPAREAQALYEESPESVERRAELAEQRRLLAASAPAPERRPDKRDRRHIIRFKSR